MSLKSQLEAQQDAALHEMSKPLDQRRAEMVDGMAKEIGAWAKSKGFREDWDEASQPYYDARNPVIAMKLMLIVSEASEALETLRDHGADACVDEGNFMEELADIMIRVLDLSEMLGGGLGEEIVKKMAKNQNRPYKHGRKI